MYLLMNKVTKCCWQLTIWNQNLQAMRHCGKKQTNKEFKNKLFTHILKLDDMSTKLFKIIFHCSVMCAIKLNSWIVILFSVHYSAWYCVLLKVVHLPSTILNNSTDINFTWLGHFSQMPFFQPCMKAWRDDSSFLHLTFSWLTGSDVFP